jgi:hypothetical protein
MSDSRSNPLSIFVDKLDITRFISKVEFVKKCATGIAIFTLISSLITFEIYRNGINNNKECIKKIDKVTDENNVTKAKLEELIETNKKLLNILEKHNILLEELKQKPLSKSSSTLSFSLDNSPKNNEKVLEEDLELLNECYDILPCNNSKKVTGLNKLFNWN